MIFSLTFLVISMGVSCIPHLFLEHGVLLKEHGSLYLNTNDEYLSVFVQVPVPDIHFLDIHKDCHKRTPFRCGPDKIYNKSCEPNNRYEALRIRNMFIDVAMEKVQRFKDLTKFTKRDKEDYWVY